MEIEKRTVRKGEEAKKKSNNRLIYGLAILMNLDEVTNFVNAVIDLILLLNP